MCTAYVFKDTQGSNDDGEPLLQVSQFRNVKSISSENVFAVVVRYFGGIKLGAGGLIRAYAKSARNFKIGNILF